MLGKVKLTAFVMCFVIVLSVSIVIAPTSVSSPGQEPLDVSGSVNGIWTKSHGPYYIEGNVTIPVGSTLNIEPGVEVYFNGSYSIWVEGSLYANGTESDRIIFTSNMTFPTSLDWRGIRFNSTGKGQLNRCNFSYGYNMVYLDGASDIIISNCSLNMSNKAITLYSISHDNLIYNCTMFDNYFGISPILNSYNNTIQDCQIFNNSYGVEFATAGENNTVINCEIKNNPWRGIDVANTNHLDIIDCEIGFNGGSLNHGIDIDDSTYINITGGSVYNSGNDGVYLFQSSNCQINDCQIYNNSIGINFAQNCNNNIVDNCSIYNGNDAIQILSGSYKNKFKNCTIYNNSFGIDAQWIQFPIAISIITASYLTTRSASAFRP